MAADGFKVEEAEAAPAAWVNSAAGKIINFDGGLEGANADVHGSKHDNEKEIFIPKRRKQIPSGMEGKVMVGIRKQH